LIKNLDPKKIKSKVQNRDLYDQSGFTLIMQFSVLKCKNKTRMNKFYYFLLSVLRFELIKNNQSINFFD